MILLLNNMKLLLNLLKNEINKHKLILIQKINEFKVYANSIDTYFIPNIYEICLKKKGNRGLVFDTNKYNINENINSYDAYKIMMNFDCFRSFNTALTLNTNEFSSTNRY